MKVISESRYTLLLDEEGDSSGSAMDLSKENDEPHQKVEVTNLAPEAQCASQPMNL